MASKGWWRRVWHRGTLKRVIAIRPCHRVEFRRCTGSLCLTALRDVWQALSPDFHPLTLGRAQAVTQVCQERVEILENALASFDGTLPQLFEAIGVRAQSLNPQTLGPQLQTLLSLLDSIGLQPRPCD